MEKKKYNTTKIAAQMNGGFLKGFLNFLDDETKPFELSIRRVQRGLWGLTLTTTNENEQYFRSLLSNPEKWAI